MRLTMAEDVHDQVLGRLQAARTPHRAPWTLQLTPLYQPLPPQRTHSCPRAYV